MSVVIVSFLWNNCRIKETHVMLKAQTVAAVYRILYRRKLSKRQAISRKRRRRKQRPRPKHRISLVSKQRVKYLTVIIIYIHMYMSLFKKLFRFFDGWNRRQRLRWFENVSSLQRICMLLWYFKQILTRDNFLINWDKKVKESHFS